DADRTAHAYAGLFGPGTPEQLRSRSSAIRARSARTDCPIGSVMANAISADLAREHTYADARWTTSRVERSRQRGRPPGAATCPTASWRSCALILSAPEPCRVPAADFSRSAVEATSGSVKCASGKTTDKMMTTLTKFAEARTAR